MPKIKSTVRSEATPHSQSQNNPGHNSKGNCARVPKYCRHAATGQGVVYIARQEYYLGEYASAESLKLYAQVVERYQAGGAAAVLMLPRGELTVAELVDQWLDWGQTRHQAAELRGMATPIRRLLKLYADLPVSKFGPVALEAVRSAMVADGLTRTGVNKAVHRLRKIWLWGVRRQLIDETLWTALKATTALAKGEEDVRESDPVLPARWQQVRAVLRNAPLPVQIMVRLQVLSGARPGEIVQVRPCDVDRRNPASWIFRPTGSKAAHLGKPRVIQFGPRAQRLLAPYMATDADLQQYTFRPDQAHRDAASRKAAGAHGIRRCSKETRVALQRRRGVKPRRCRERYTTDSYRKAIQRACEQVWPLPSALARAKGESPSAWEERLGNRWPAVEAWRREHLLHPHQLRHSFATRIGNRYSEEEAQVLLGHSQLRTTAIYVERDIRRGRRIIAREG